MQGTGQVPGRLGQAFTRLPQAGGSPAHSRWTPPVHSALTPAQGSPERAGCRLATAAPGLWGSFLPGGTKRRSGHCWEVCPRKVPQPAGNNWQCLEASLVMATWGSGVLLASWVEARDAAQTSYNAQDSLHNRKFSFQDVSNAQVKSSFTPSPPLPDFPTIPSTSLFFFIQLASFLKKLKYSWCKILYKLQVYNIVIHNFKGYTPLIVIIKYWLYSLCCKYILVAYFIHNSWYLLISHPYVALCPLLPAFLESWCPLTQFSSLLWLL